MDKLTLLTKRMCAYFAGDPKRIQHFLKVHAFARLIAAEEGLGPETRELLEAAALVHDIGIKKAEEKYGKCDGKLQEQEGPAEARRILSGLDFDEETVQRICWLVGHHHTYSNMDGVDYQILVEADFLVNLFEHGTEKSAIQSAYDRVFATETGKWYCRTLFDL